VQEIIAENAGLFQRIAIHPSTNFPGRTHEAILLQLLRKKPEPEVEERVAQARQVAAETTPDGIATLNEVWSDLREWCAERIPRYVRQEAGDVYTAEERAMGIEKVRTGLKRNLEESDEESSEEEEEEDEDENDVVMVDASRDVIAEVEPGMVQYFASRLDGETPKFLGKAGMQGARR
jgi:mediator of RNA polymerase II transcription subunit 8